MLHQERLNILEEVKEAQKQSEKKQVKISSYKSAFFKKMVKREGREFRKLKAEEQKKKENRMKKKHYGEYVKEFFKANSRAEFTQMGANCILTTADKMSRRWSSTQMRLSVRSKARSRR
jgi:hypothetical protein